MKKYFAFAPGRGSSKPRRLSPLRSRSRSRKPDEDGLGKARKSQEDGFASRCQGLGLLDDAFERNGRIFYDAYQHKGVVSDAIIDNMAHLTKGQGTTFFHNVETPAALPTRDFVRNNYPATRGSHR